MFSMLSMMTTSQPALPALEERFLLKVQVCCTEITCHTHLFVSTLHPFFTSTRALCVPGFW